MKKLLFALSILLYGASAHTQTKFTPELLWKLGRLSEPKISPDGKSVLYGVTYYDLKANKGNRDLYVIPTAGGTARKLTATDFSESNALWRPDGKKIGFISSESGSSQMWEMNPDGSDKVRVTDEPGGITGFQYAPSGNRILFTKQVKLDKTVAELYPDLPQAKGMIIDDLMYRHWDEWADGTYSHIFYADYGDGKLTSTPKDIMQGERFDSPLKPLGGMEEICWSPDGKKIAYTCKKMSGKAYALSTNSDIYLYDVESGQTVNLSAENKGYDRQPAFSPDGSRLVWLSMEREGFEADRDRLFCLDFKRSITYELTATLVDNEVKFDQTVEHFSWTPDSKKILFISPVQATKQVYVYDFAPKKKLNYITRLTEGDADFVSAQQAGGTVIAERTTMNQPTELYRIDLKTRKTEQLTAVNNELLGNIPTSKIEKRFVKTTDGKDMLVWMVFPPDFDPAKKYPTLLYCQGGPQSVTSQAFSYRWNFRLMAANGYIVVVPARRGMPSFGQEWNDAISGDWGGQPMRDYLSAIDAAAKEPYVDKTRLGAVGASYGGYSVYYLAGIHQKRFKTFIAHCGVYNLESWYGTTEEMFFANWDMKGAYWDTPQPKGYDAFSPHKFVRNWDAPILVIHGAKDFRVPLEQGMQAFDAARLRGIPSRFLYLPEEGHWVLKPQNALLWQRVFFEWLDNYLK